ncbi:641_t:CDS:2, partial [Acaulospora colombiana]
MAQTIADSQYAKKASKYIEILNQLRRIGAHFTVNLPTIVFCGNQSAGKSSLLEAISGVALPRSDGTCTRCVMELQLIESEEPWECQISLRHEYDEDGKPLLRPNETKFGAKIYNPKDVELMARRAQKALLNSSDSIDRYLDWNFDITRCNGDSDSNSLKFTKNIVCLEIKGNNVPNLSLIDLPGIIRHTEKIEDRKFIQLVLDLVNSYIEREKSIIIATISCKDEIDNQEIISLAKIVDPSGSRTLGVLTKPDIIEPGTHEPWLRIIRGEAHKLSLGYYIVKNPNKKRLMENITLREAREEEIDFFKNEMPWKDYRNHLSELIGIEKLQQKLSDLLIKAIINDLPEISKEIQKNLDKTRRELDKIPEPSSKTPRMELYHLIKEYTAIINEEVACSRDNNELWNYINNEFEKFKKSLRSSLPIFSFSKKKSRETVKFSIFGTYINVPEQEQSSSIGSEEFSMTKITDRISCSRGRLLPGFVPYSVVMKLIRDSKRKWKTLSHECLFQVYEIMADFMKRVLDE